MSESPTIQTDTKKSKVEFPGELVFSGYLNKEGSNWKTWKNRWFEIYSEGDLVYRKSQEDTSYLNTFNIQNSQFSETEEKGKPFCIKILKKDQKFFYVCANTSTDYANLKKQLLEIEGTRLVDDKSLVKVTSQKVISIKQKNKRPKTRLESVDVNKWSTEDVCDWMQCITLRFQRPELTSQYVKAIQDKKITGYQLLQLTSDDLKKLNIKSMGQRAHIKDEIEKLEKNRYFDQKQQSIFLKFSKLDVSNNKHIKMGNWVESLCDVEQIQKTYLSNNLDSLPLEEFVDQEDMQEIEKEKKIQNLQGGKNVKLRVKLVITEICHSDTDKALRMVLSPIISKIPIVNSGDFGLFHTALIIGPFYLEWTDSSLCVPKKMVSSMALLSADIDEIAVKQESLSELTQKIAEVVVNWNTNYTYKKTNVNPNEHEGNCQDFVDEILSTVGINTTVFGGALGNFLVDMRTKGTSKIQFTADKYFKQYFGLKKSAYDFPTHKELDEFACQLLEREPMLKQKFPSEYALLKSFDRAFWLRYFKSPNNKITQPITAEIYGKEIQKCPFGNPRETKSMF